MKFNITKFSEKKAKEAVVNSSKIEGYRLTHDRILKIRIHKIASRLCS